METKVCIKCGKELPANVEYFAAHKQCRNGITNICKECRREYNKSYRDAHKEEARTSNKAYIDAHKDYYREYRREYAAKYYAANKDRYRTYSEAYRATHKEEIKARQKEYRETHKDVIRYRYEEHREERRALAAKYRETHKEEIREYRRKYGSFYDQIRHAREKGVPATLSANDWVTIKNLFQNRCAYCGRAEKLEKEHFLPLSLGGGFTKENIIPACRSCNAKKHNSLFCDWYPKQPFYSPEREAKILEYIKEVSE